MARTVSPIAAPFPRLTRVFQIRVDRYAEIARDQSRPYPQRMAALKMALQARHVVDVVAQHARERAS